MRRYRINLNDDMLERVPAGEESESDLVRIADVQSLLDRQPPVPPQVVYDGNLTSREHAIVEARKFQLDELAANTNPNMFVPSRAYIVVAELLMTFNHDELMAIYRKAGIK